MAKTTPAQMLANATADLKAELRRLVRVITANDDAAVPAETFKDAELVLSQLHRLHSLRHSPSPSSDPQPKASRPSTPRSSPPPPDHFVCPISGELMNDPVVLASGETFDRPFIQRRLDSGDRTCPRTQEVLSDATLIPNNHLRRMISQWCSEHGVPFKRPGDGELVVARADREKLDELLHTFSTSTLRADRKAAVRKIRELTRSDRSLRELFGINPDAVLKFVSAPTDDDDPEAQEDKVTTMFNLTLQDCNRKAIGEIPSAVAFLIDSLSSGTMQSRGNAAATLFNLAVLNANKAVIGEMGAMGPLVDLLNQGSPAAKLDTVRALFDLCMCQENKSRAADAGVVKALLRCIADGSQVDGSLAVLAMLSGSSQQVRDEIGGSSGMEILLRVMRESPSEKNKENAVALVHAVCMSDRLSLREVREEEEVHGTMTQVKEKGTERARRKAGQILERLRRTALSTNNSC